MTTSTQKKRSSREASGKSVDVSAHPTIPIGRLVRSVFGNPENSEGPNFLRSRWRITTPRQSLLRLKFRRSELTYDDMHELFAALLSGRKGQWRLIAFDLGAVHDIPQPWTTVFALILYWAAKTGAHIQLLGLNHRLAAMASMALDGLRPARVEWRENARYDPHERSFADWSALPRA